MTQSTYSRVEFTTDFGCGPKVIAFVDFSSSGISMGAPPYKVQICEGTPEDKSGTFAIREYQRVAVHADGRAQTHWPIPNVPTQMKEFDENTPPLARWGKPRPRTFELNWSEENMNAIGPWLAKPKPPSSRRTCLTPVEFKPEVDYSVVGICIANPQSDVNQLARLVPMDRLAHDNPRPIFEFELT